MTKITFKSIYSATKEAIKALKEPIVLNKNKRAVASAIDDAETQKINAQTELQSHLEVITEGKVIDVNKVLQLRQTIKDADATIAELKEFDSEFFAEESE